MAISAYAPDRLALAFCSGLAFSCIGVGYRAAQARKVTAAQVACVICLVGVGYFAVLPQSRPWSSVPGENRVMAGIAGAGQCTSLKMIGPALARGPLSPMWCALNLGFVITIGYARLFLGERVSPLGYLGMLAAIACVMAASSRPQPAPSGEAAATSSLRARLTYGTILLVMLVGNSLWLLSIKHFSVRTLPNGQSYLSVFGHQFTLAVYLVLGLFALGEVARTRRTLGPWPPWLLLGGLAAAGSVLGTHALNTCASLPAAVVVTINNVVSLLFAALISVLIFRERRTPSWYATIGLAVAAVVLVNVTK